MPLAADDSTAEMAGTHGDDRATTRLIAIEQCSVCPAGIDPAQRREAIRGLRHYLRSRGR